MFYKTSMNNCCQNQFESAQLTILCFLLYRSSSLSEKKMQASISVEQRMTQDTLSVHPRWWKSVSVSQIILRGDDEPQYIIRDDLKFCH